MVKIELITDANQCIETAARRAFSDIIRRMLSRDNGEEILNEKAEILRVFLQTADFGKLRAVSEKQVQQGKQGKFEVYIEDGSVKIDMKDHAGIDSKDTA